MINITSQQTTNNRPVFHRSVVIIRLLAFAIILTFSFFHPFKSYAGSNPVITLVGDSGLLDTMKVEQGYAFTEPGYTATSSVYGNITDSVVVNSEIVGGTSLFNNQAVGTYIFTYDVTDHVGNKAATQYRVVRVTPDKTPPDLKIALSKNGSDTIYQEVTSVPIHLQPALSSYIISSKDIVDGNLFKSIVIDSSQVQTVVVGIYPVTYSSTDLSKNTATVIHYIKVIDTIKPVLTLLGTNPYLMDVDVPFMDPGVMATVSNSYLTTAQLNRFLSISNPVNDSALGSYRVTYSLTDTFGNVAIPVTRTVNVVDRDPPVITLKGPEYDSILVNTTYTDSGFTVSDNYWTNAGGIKLTESGTFVSNFPHNYANRLGGGHDSATIIDPLFTSPIGPEFTVTYTATDGSGNVSSVTRHIMVYDNIPPMIGLIGPATVQVCKDSLYIDPGYTGSDNYTDSAHLFIQHYGSYYTLGTSTPGIVSLWYSATDEAGNISYSPIRYIQVLPSNDANCQAGRSTNNVIDTTVCKSSCPVFSAHVSGSSYSWSTGASTKTTQLCISNDTAISVTITTGSTSVSYLYNITVTKTTCVWPGDANDDGMADKNDILAIGIAYGDTGAKRSGASINWTGQPCNDWAPSFKSGANYKNADCNGDGTIDSTDMSAVSKNYGYLHYKTNSSNGSPTDPPLSITFSKDSAIAGDTVTASITLGSSGIPVKNAYGLAFSIPYNFFYVKPGKASVNLSNCWLGTPGKDLVYFLHDDPANNVVDFAITRIDHKNITSGYGAIGKVSVVMQDNLGGKTWVNRKVVLTPSEVNLISFDETQIPLYAQGDSMIVTGPLSGIYNTSGIIGRIKLYPNPASQNIFIDAGDQQVSGIRLINELGKQVFEQTSPSKGIVELPLSGLGSGIYTVIISTKNGTITRQILKN